MTQLNEPPSRPDLRLKRLALMVLNSLIFWSLDGMLTELSQDLSLQALTLPKASQPAAAEAVSTAPSAEFALLTPASQVLRSIASSAPEQEISFFKFQVEARSADVSSSESYLQGSLPSPQALLRAAA